MAKNDYDDQNVGKDGLTERERETLPVWAQERMASLRFDAEKARKQYEDQFDSQEPTTVAYGKVYDNPKYLPDDRYSLISVRLDGGTEPADGVWLGFRRMTENVGGGHYVEVSSSDGIAVVSQAANVVRLFPFRDSRVTSIPEK